MKFRARGYHRRGRRTPDVPLLAWSLQGTAFQPPPQKRVVFLGRRKTDAERHAEAMLAAFRGRLDELAAHSEMERPND